MLIWGSSVCDEAGKFLYFLLKFAMNIKMLQIQNLVTSLVVLWLRLCLPMQRAGVSSILGQGHGINHMPLVGCGQKLKKKKKQKHLLLGSPC